MAKFRSWASAGALRTLATKNMRGLDRPWPYSDRVGISSHHKSSRSCALPVSMASFCRNFSNSCGCSGRSAFPAVAAAAGSPANRAAWRPTRGRSRPGRSPMSCARACVIGVAARVGTPLHLNTRETWAWNSGTSATAATPSAPHTQAGSASRARRGRRVLTELDETEAGIQAEERRERVHGQIEIDRRQREARR